MPGDINDYVLNTYVVKKPLPVQAGKSEPWFDQTGLGTQYKTNMNVTQLLKEGYIGVK